MTAWSGLRWVLRRVRERCYVDIGPPEATILVAGMGRSGTTWVADIINHDFSYRMMFEPLLSRKLRALLGFEYIQFMDRSTDDASAAQTMERLLAGRIRVGSADRGHRHLLFRRRIVKSIRCNLMLGWLRQIRPAMPIVLVIRNPLAVTASWLRLGWAGPSAPPDIDIILAQSTLLETYPVLRRAAHHIDHKDPFERVLLEWCIMHYVPLQQLNSSELLVLRYEDLVSTPDPTLDRLSAYLGVTINPTQRARVLRRFASTNFLGRTERSSVALLTHWRKQFTPSQMDRARAILAMCELAHHYSIDAV